MSESEEKFRSLFENSPIGIAFHKMIYDEEGKPIDFLYLEANKNFQEFTGSDPTGRLVTEVFPGIEKDPNFDWIGTCARAARDGETIRFQQYLPPVDRWYDIVAYQNKPDHFVVSFLEITEQKKTEQMLHHSSKLDAIGQLAGGIAHDFNNMLGGIMGAAELLDHTIEKGSLHQKYVKIILESVNRATGLTGKLLSFSRNTATISTRFDLHEVIKGAMQLLELSVDKQIEIQFEQSDKTCIIIGDPSQIESVFLNLGVNAAHAIEEKGKLHISCKSVELDESSSLSSSLDLKPGAYIEVTVTDNGRGIAPDDLDKIFEPFFTTKKHGSGTGLGLASVYSIVRQHRGTIYVYSEEGRGARFTLLFPLAEAEDPAALPDDEMKKGTGCILVVDDEEIMRQTATSILEELGYSVMLAENGRIGLEKYLQHMDTIDGVLLDMIMPVMNGRDCFDGIIQHNPDARVVLCSGFSREDHLQEMLDKGLRGFVQKPYKAALLSQIIAKALQADV